MSFKDIWKEIESSDSISLFRHVQPDPDALGSQFGLAEIIRTNFPDKKVYCYGEISHESFEDIFSFDFETESPSIEKDLAIILDTANLERIDGEAWKQARKSIKFDHHLGIDNYADINKVDHLWVATSEGIAKMVMDLGLKINKRAATYLFTGIVGDSGRFQYENTKPETLRIGAMLMEQGVDTQKVFEKLYTMPLKLYNLQNYVRSNMVMIKNVAYSILEEGIEDKFGVSYVDCKNMVYTLSGINEATIWLLATYDKEINKWRVSMRSRFNTINEVANEFGGGGHRLAAAARVDSINDVRKIIDRLVEVNK